ncbi:MAG TPA: hypothetical protein VE643_02125 [Nitrososphaeraceae archaeon]|nr:hypothetical protein [Nitrososphaeraceae archaeon]
MILTQTSASFISNDYHLYASAASKNKNDTSTEDASTDDTTPSAPVGSKTFLTVTTKVSGGPSKPSDFMVSVSGKNPSPKSFSGSSSGTSVTLNAGKYKVAASGPSDYTTSYSSGCSGTASGGTPINCTVSNEYTGAPPGSSTFLNVITDVDNSNGGNKKPSDFTLSVSGNNPSPRSFSGSSSGTSVTLKAGGYQVIEENDGTSGYSVSYSSGCSGTANGGVPIKCTVTNKYTGAPPGSTTFLDVITNVINNNQGTKKPSDFTITVKGNNPSPRSFDGSSSGTFVTLSTGAYKVTITERPAGYTTSYSSGCSGTARGGTPIKCTISNQYRTRPSPPQPPVPNLTITTNSSSIYSIPSTSVQVDKFSSNYTIAGTVSSLIDSKDLITSTIVNDFDKNPNIGYIVNDSSGNQALSTRSPTSPSQTQPGMPNPFVSIDLINRKITNVIQNAMEATATSFTNSPEKHAEIKCTFGTILADYNCS